MSRTNYFAPTGPTFDLHREERERVGINFSNRVADADAPGATLAVTFWRSTGGQWVAADAGDFGDPDPDWDAGTRTARFWLGEGVSGPAAAGPWGVKVVLALGARTLVADCPITLRGAMSV